MKDEYSYELIKREEYDKGVQEGARQTALETAKKMLSKGLDVSLISEITGLKTDDILEFSIKT
jgi:predicted transposase/invertase (TIGR01784 family)